MPEISSELLKFLKGAQKIIGLDATLNEASEFLGSLPNEEVLKICGDFTVCVSSISWELGILISQSENNVKLSTFLNEPVKV